MGLNKNINWGIFFPAFIPLAGAMPWLVSFIIGIIVLIAGFSWSNFFKQNKKVIISIILLTSFTISGWIIYSKDMHKELTTIYSGTRVVAPKDFPAAVTYKEPEGYINEYSHKFRPIWSIKTPHAVLSDLVIQDDTLIYGTMSGSVEAISLNNGEPVWHLPQNTFVMSVAKDNSGNIYIGEGVHHTQIATFTSFNTNTKKVNWQRKFHGHIESLTVIDEVKNKVWMTAGPGGLWSLNKADGKVIHHFPIGHIDYSPLIENNIVYAQAQPDEAILASKIYALNQENGTIIWDSNIKGQPWGTPVMHMNGEIILTSTGIGQLGINKPTDTGWVYALSKDGKILWEKQLPNKNVGAAIYIPSYNLYINTVKSGDVIALDATKGDIIWQKKVGSGFMAGATLVNHFHVPMLAYVTDKGIFKIVDARNGNILADYTIGNYSSSSPVIFGNSVFVATAYGVVAFSGLQNLIGN